ncbi:MAG: ATP synthase F1 subunit gamma [Nitrospinae bacterium]|nr:ATP synthase F1 subunit gamma [Nitrospinota bacterium]
MANLKDIKRRIGSVKNTQQITKAMKLVAAARLRRAQEAVAAARPYSDKIHEVMERLSAKADTDSHPLLKRREVKNVLIVLCSGDKGLCGPFNSNVIKATQQVIAANEGKNVSLVVVGKKGVDFYRRRSFPLLSRHLDYSKNLTIDYARQIVDVVVKKFVEEQADKVYLIYNKFRNVVVQVPQTVPLLPVQPPVNRDEDLASTDADAVDYEYEPSAEAVLDGVITLYIENQIFQALLESAASENGARMTAMDSATRNAKEMIEALTLSFNKARQAAITTELSEVVSGADALEG